jgi:hypothetical protein
MAIAGASDSSSGCGAAPSVFRMAWRSSIWLIGFTR